MAHGSGCLTGTEKQRAESMAETYCEHSYSPPEGSSAAAGRGWQQQLKAKKQEFGAEPDSSADSNNASSVRRAHFRDGEDETLTTLESPGASHWRQEGMRRRSSGTSSSESGQRSNATSRGSGKRSQQKRSCVLRPLRRVVRLFKEPGFMLSKLGCFKDESVEIEYAAHHLHARWMSARMFSLCALPVDISHHLNVIVDRCGQFGPMGWLECLRNGVVFEPELLLHCLLVSFIIALWLNFFFSNQLTKSRISRLANLHSFLITCIYPAYLLVKVVRFRDSVRTSEDFLLFRFLSFTFMSCVVSSTWYTWLLRQSALVCLMVGATCTSDIPCPPPEMAVMYFLCTLVGIQLVAAYQIDARRAFAMTRSSERTLSYDSRDSETSGDSETSANNSIFGQTLLLIS